MITADSTPRTPENVGRPAARERNPRTVERIDVPGRGDELLRAPFAQYFLTKKTHRSLHQGGVDQSRHGQQRFVENRSRGDGVLAVVANVLVTTESAD